MSDMGCDSFERGERLREKAERATEHELLERLDTVILENRMLSHKLDALRRQNEFLLRELTHIHALLYPPQVKLDDGRVMQFRSPMRVEQIQALSDAIRAIPQRLQEQHHVEHPMGHQ